MFAIFYLLFLTPQNYNKKNKKNKNFIANIKNLKKIKISKGDRRDRCWLGGRGGISLFIPSGKRLYEPKKPKIFDFSLYTRPRVPYLFIYNTNLLIFR